VATQSTETKTDSTKTRSESDSLPDANAEPARAPQGEAAGAVIIPQGVPEPQVGGVYPTDLGEYGKVRGQLPKGHEAVHDPVAAATKDAEIAAKSASKSPDEEKTQEEQEAEGRQVIGEPTIYKAP